ncbi:MAG: prepilin-type N-terminal cleavage/methylation domain-containing protein [Acutalibacteraceae bacterium]|nr:prepilin-type N-terminal cleavage/methylation domain-containing protein [Acutalibacteraceae bacterium]
MLKRIKNTTKGFSLIELIVVIAIMVVLAAVLAPALLGYVEKSRAQKDSSAMDEVTNAITLSLAEPTIYDELLQASVKDNYSCYCDGDTSTNIEANKIITKSPDLWLYNDDARMLDENVYKPIGKMRGVTITFKPNGRDEYILKDGIINKIGDDTTKKGTLAGKTLGELDFEGLYNRLRSTVGDVVKVSSQTYRNSDYTIFISMGTTGGNQADKQDAIQVYGQYNGTNLSDVAGKGSEASGQQGEEGSEVQEPKDPLLNPSGIIPEGAIYKRQDGTVFNAGDSFPDDFELFDEYHYADYYYVFDCYYDQYWGWTVCVKDWSKSSYGAILESINGKPIIGLYETFGCLPNITTAPKIPDSVINLDYAFMECPKLTEAPEIPSGVLGMTNAFSDCPNLKGTLVVHANPTSYSNCIRGTQITSISGNCSLQTKVNLLGTK